jgi:D-alanine-D-alanine ligase
VRVAVLFGGLSEERDVSVASGIQAMLALERAGHDVVAIDTARGILEPAERDRLLATGVPAEPPSGGDLMRTGQGAAGLLGRTSDLRRADVVFIALHGGSGEDGTVQALLDLVGVPYTGTGHLGSAYAMDKDVAKRLFRSAGVPTPDWRMAPTTPADVRQHLGLPVVVKPTSRGPRSVCRWSEATTTSELRSRSPHGSTMRSWWNGSWRGAN